MYNKFDEGIIHVSYKSCFHKSNHFPMKQILLSPLDEIRGGFRDERGWAAVHLRSALAHPDTHPQKT